MKLIDEVIFVMNPDHLVHRDFHAIVPWHPPSSPGRPSQSVLALPDFDLDRASPLSRSQSVLALPDYDLESLLTGIIEESPAPVEAIVSFLSPTRPSPRAVAQSPSSVVSFGIADTPQPNPQAP